MLAAFKHRALALSPGFIRAAWGRIEASPLGYRLARGAFWSLAGAMIARGLGLLASIVVARLLGKTVFGELGIIQSTVVMFGTFAGFGLGLTATKYVAEFRQKDPARAGRILSLSGVVSWTAGALATTVLILLAPWLAAQTLAAPHLAGALRISALLVFLGAVNGAQTGALAGFEAFRRIAHVNCWAGLANFPCLTLGCWLFGLPGALWGLAAAQAIGCLLNRYALVQTARLAKVPLWRPDWRDEWPVLWNFSLPAAAASLLITPSLWFCQTLLVNHSAGYPAMAEYAVGAQWRAFVQYLPALFCAAYLPVAASVEMTNYARRRKLMLLNTAFGTGATTLIALAVLLASPWILAAYGQGFTGAYWTFGFLLLAGVADAANNILFQTLMASGMAWLRLISNAIWAILLLAASFWLVPKYAALGLALAACAAQAGHLCLQIPLSFYALRKAC